jgi:hypothetical protein
VNYVKYKIAESLQSFMIYNYFLIKLICSQHVSPIYASVGDVSWLNRGFAILQDMSSGFQSEMTKLFWEALHA